MMIGFMTLQSCSTNKPQASKNTIYWIGSYKTDCYGVGKMKCLSVQKSEQIDDSKWQLFYSPIEGFDFEEGYLKKIEVKEEALNPKNVPADASSVKYTLVREIEKKVDFKALLSGKWLLSSLNDNPINRSVTLPKMEISLTQMKVSGNGGCNNYNGTIKTLTAQNIEFGDIASTQMACVNRNIEHEFLQALGAAATYQIKGPGLTFFNKEGKKILSFLKVAPADEAQGLENKWVAVRISGNPIDGKDNTPTMQINLKEMRISGNDGCNNYTGPINKASDAQLILGNLVSTKKMCPDMEVAQGFSRALAQTAAFKFDGDVLTLLTANGIEVLAFTEAK